jgi:hypothetical protein
VAKRPTGTDPAEIALWSLFTPGYSNASSAPGFGTETLLAQAASKIFTPATARLIDPAVSSSNLSALAVGANYTKGEVEVIPFGFGYADQGKAKLNLNTNLVASSLTNIVGAITRNLTNFSQRSGAMNPTAYLN